MFGYKLVNEKEYQELCARLQNSASMVSDYAKEVELLNEKVEYLNEQISILKDDNEKLKSETLEVENVTPVVAEKKSSTARTTVKNKKSDSKETKTRKVIRKKKGAE